MSVVNRILYKGSLLSVYTTSFVPPFRCVLTFKTKSKTYEVSKYLYAVVGSIF